VEQACDPEMSEDTPCQDGNCEDDTSLCTAYVVQDTEGAECDDLGIPSFGTQLCDAFASLVCVDDMCELTDRSAGSPCNTGYWFDAALCPPQPLGETGDDCLVGDDCESGLCRGTCADTLCGSD
jgi:hypothetical protein